MTATQIRLVVPKIRVDDVEARLFELAPIDTPPALASFEIEGTDDWQIDAYFETPPDDNQLSTALAGFPYTREVAEEVDWVAQSLSHHHEVHARRFHVYGSHHDTPPVKGWSIKVDAGMAFGTGQHDTTKGCLLALDDLARRRYILGNVLDLGCGTGILAIALSQMTNGRVMASDIDPIAVDVAKENARLNGRANDIEFVVSEGLKNRALFCPAGYDLIVANILAKPLVNMATGVASALRPGGFLILSGLLTSQEQLVRTTYRNRGFAIRRRLVLGEWSTLLLRRLA